MATFDRLLVGPTAEELERALAEAAASANEGANTGELVWPPPTLPGDLASAGRRREGHCQWLGNRNRRVSPRSGVALSWWTDHLARRHFRIVGRHSYFRGDERQAVLGHNEPLPAAALVYPGRFILREQAREPTLWALCECGACGPLKVLGWMGPSCGPCHDRGEAGEPLPATGPRALLFAPSVPVRDLVWASDGDSVVSSAFGLAPEARFWRLRTGQVERVGFAGSVSAVASAPAAGLLAFGFGGHVALWGPGKERRQFDTAGGWAVRAVALSPDGSFLAAAGGA
jgi:hypothetical protein